ncbi:hypothetical protein GCM10023196_101140 [Actinoallomurus vinaceus]|uniref:Uncharacterized protein n=1 Tax=Actinoallomurus vinaceus TaxID=1080074 RepID=A0ABP8UVW7_9ACTN
MPSGDEFLDEGTRETVALPTTRYPVACCGAVRPLDDKRVRPVEMVRQGVHETIAEVRAGGRFDHAVQDAQYPAEIAEVQTVIASQQCSHLATEGAPKNRPTVKLIKNQRNPHPRVWRET